MIPATVIHRLGDDSQYFFPMCSSRIKLSLSLARSLNFACVSCKFFGLSKNFYFTIEFNLFRVPILVLRISILGCICFHFIFWLSFFAWILRLLLLLCSPHILIALAFAPAPALFLRRCVCVVLLPDHFVLFNLIYVHITLRLNVIKRSLFMRHLARSLFAMY